MRRLPRHVALLLLATATAGACSVPAREPVVAPSAVLMVRPKLVAGPRNEGCAVVLGAAQILTCAHVIPADASEYTIGNIVVRRRPVASGAGRSAVPRITDDWTVVEMPETMDAIGSVDLQSPIEPGTRVWIVGWKRGNDDGALSVYRREVVGAQVDRQDDDGFWCLRDVPDGDYAGLSGSPVVAMVGDEPVVIGMYCGFVAMRESVLGVTISERREYVFIRPDLSQVRT
ncbi:MAG: trypsin-like peptidase domain-containing protein [Planctomycetota bacterium]